jgi:hypothetical protein
MYNCIIIDIVFLERSSISLLSNSSSSNILFPYSQKSFDKHLKIYENQYNNTNNNIPRAKDVNRAGTSSATAAKHKKKETKTNEIERKLKLLTTPTVSSAAKFVKPSQKSYENLSGSSDFKSSRPSTPKKKLTSSSSSKY